MKLKPGVKLTSLQPQIVLAAMMVERMYAAAGGECTITSANDSTHGTSSLHYAGCALDFRTKDFGGDKVALLADIRAALGEEFDVLLEHPGGDEEHIHVEYDPE